MLTNSVPPSSFAFWIKSFLRDLRILFLNSLITNLTSFWPIIQSGLKPVFVDVERKTYNLDSKLVKGSLTEATKAIIPVHLFGLCADMDGIREVLPENIKILEDLSRLIDELF